MGTHDCDFSVQALATLGVILFSPFVLHAEPTAASRPANSVEHAAQPMPKGEVDFPRIAWDFSSGKRVVAKWPDHKTFPGQRVLEHCDVAIKIHDGVELQMPRAENVIVEGDPEVRAITMSSQVMPVADLVKIVQRDIKAHVDLSGLENGWAERVSDGHGGNFSAVRVFAAPGPAVVFTARAVPGSQQCSYVLTISWGHDRKHDSGAPKADAKLTEIKPPQDVLWDFSKSRSPAIVQWPENWPASEVLVLRRKEGFSFAAKLSDGKTIQIPKALGGLVFRSVKNKADVSRVLVYTPGMSAAEASGLILAIAGNLVTKDEMDKWATVAAQDWRNFGYHPFHRVDFGKDVPFDIGYEIVGARVGTSERDKQWTVKVSITWPADEPAGGR